MNTRREKKQFQHFIYVTFPYTQCIIYYYILIITSFFHPQLFSLSVCLFLFLSLRMFFGLYSLFTFNIATLYVYLFAVEPHILFPPTNPTKLNTFCVHFNIRCVNCICLCLYMRSWCVCGKWLISIYFTSFCSKPCSSTVCRMNANISSHTMTLDWND